MEMPQPTDQRTPRKNVGRVILIIAVLVVIGIIAFIAYQIVNPSINSSLKRLSDTENEYDNKTDGYSLPVPTAWRIFEEMLHPERKTYTAEDIKEKLAECGPSCASFSVVKMGNYLSSPCETGNCGDIPESKGASMTIYGLANPGNLSLDNFLEQAFSKILGGENVHGVAFGVNEETGEALFEGRVEFNVNEDETELRSYFFILHDGIYYFDQDMSATNLDDTEAILLEMERAIGLFDYK